MNGYILSVVNLPEFSLFFIGHHSDRKSTGNDQNGLNYRIGTDCADHVQGKTRFGRTSSSMEATMKS